MTVWLSIPWRMSITESPHFSSRCWYMLWVLQASKGGHIESRPQKFTRYVAIRASRSQHTSTLDDVGGTGPDPAYTRQCIPMGTWIWRPRQVNQMNKFNMTYLPTSTVNIEGGSGVESSYLCNECLEEIPLESENTFYKCCCHSCASMPRMQTYMQRKANWDVL